MTKKLNKLAEGCHIETLDGTFDAVVKYCENYSRYDKGVPTVVVGTLAAGLKTGVNDFYSPVFPRGLRLNTPEEVWEADLDVQRVQIFSAPSVGEPEVIISGHSGTREVLVSRWPSATVIEGNVSPDDITDKVVVGTLPQGLAAVAAGYYPATIADFDYSKDGELAGDELRKRLIISDVPITVSVS